MKMNYAGIILLAIGVVIALSLTPTISDKAKEIENDENSSAVAKSLAPYADVLWVAGVFSFIAGAVYREFKKGGGK